uniref:Uncharacterized protein n=1 Tax=viral metagenome TaxID=1070528 RepID=A0A6C0D549_9ZZZZ
MVTVKKGITKANKYTKKRGRLIHNNNNNNNNNSNNTKILHNFYKGLLKTNKDLALLLTPERNSNTQFLEYIYKQLNAKQLIINALAIEKSRTSENNKSIIVNKITNIVNNHLRSSKYIDSELINFILTNTNCKIVTYKNTIKGKTYIFDFIIYNDELSIKNLDLIVEKMLLVLQLIIAISNNESRNGQHVTFFLTPFQKKLNSNTNVLGAKNVNSGFTYPYLKNGVTFIYRKEEFFKVFIHESIHYYGIDKALHKDFSNDAKYSINYNKFINSFNIRPQDIAKIGINEALTEYWTFIVYLSAQSYKKSIVLANFIYEFENSYKLELLHIIFQVVKILNYNKLTYSEFLTKYSNQYKETSHIFSYYIVKTLLVYNHSDLLKSTMFDINFSSSLNIALKSDPNSINTFFIKLLSYATDLNFINIINKVSAYITNTKTNTRSIYKQRIILSNLMMMYNDNNII